MKRTLQYLSWLLALLPDSSQIQAPATKKTKHLTGIQGCVFFPSHDSPMILYACRDMFHLSMHKRLKQLYGDGIQSNSFS